MSQTAPRPSAVSSACLFIGLSSVLLLVYVMQWLTSWDSLQQQEIIAGVGKALNLTDTAALATSLRVVLMGMVVVLVTGGVGAIYTARGDQLSRFLVSVVGVMVAMLFVFTGSLIGLIPGAFAIASVVRLWSGEATRWFAERNGKVSKQAARRTLEPTATGAQPGEIPGVGSQPGHDQYRAGYYPPPPPRSAVPTNQAAAGWKRPSSVNTAALVTALGSFTALGSAALFLVMYAVFPRSWWIQAQQESPLYERMNLTEADIVESLTMTMAISAATVVLSLLALVAAYALSRRQRWASPALIVLCAVTIAFGVMTIVGIIWTGLAIWVIVLVRRHTTRVWLARRP